MNTISLLGAVAGGLIGAAIWAAITYLTGYEVGYVAWAVGGLVGLGTVKLGGKGATLATAAGAIALGAMVLGKVGALHLTLNSGKGREQLSQELRKHYTREQYDQTLALARDYPRDPTDDRLIEFCKRHNIPLPEGRTAEALAELRQDGEPLFIKLRDESLDYEAWLDFCVEQDIASVQAHAPLLEMVKEDLNPIDLIFAFLGLATAFGMVRRAGLAPPASASAGAE